MTALRVVRVVLWLLPIGGVVLGSFVLITGMATATGAPQEAVVCALACALAILPYVLSRSLAEISLQFESNEYEKQTAKDGDKYEQYRETLDSVKYKPDPVLTVDESLSSFTRSDETNIWRIATIAFGAIAGISLIVFLAMKI